MKTGGNNQMKEIHIKVYEFDELTDEAKEKARDWYRIHALDYDWWTPTYEDAATIGLKINGFDLYRQEIDGEFIGEPLETIEKILENHGKTCETYNTAKRYEPNLRVTLAATQEEDAGMTEEDAYANCAHEFLQDLLEDYRIILQHDEEYLLSDEFVDETIRINEYTFTESGKREG